MGPPDPEPQAGPSVPPRLPSPLPVVLRPSMEPAASKPLADSKETAPAVASSSKAALGQLPNPSSRSWLRLSPMGGQTPWEGLPQQLCMPPRLLCPPADSVLSLRPWGGLMAVPTHLEEQEESVPITPEQRPKQERIKKLAQEERERVALQMSPGQLQFFGQREIDMEIANEYDCP